LVRPTALTALSVSSDLSVLSLLTVLSDPVLPFPRSPVQPYDARGGDRTHKGQARGIL